MRLLGFDTSAGRCSAAFGNNGRIVSARSEDLERGHAERLIPMIQEVLSEADSDWRAIDCLTVTTGPGSFTGIRTGIAAVRGFALALSLKVLPLSVFEVLAQAVAHERSASLDSRPILIVLDARRSQVFGQLFDNEGVPLDGPMCAAATDLAPRLPSKVRLVGSGASLMSPLMDDQEIIDIAVDARYLLRAAWRRLDHGAEPVVGFDVNPLYLRPADANPAAGRSLLETAKRS